MDWSAIAPIVGAIAPTAGSILGGLIPFPGGSLIGAALGKLIASKLGVPPTPEAVNTALSTAGEETKRSAINAAVEQARIEVQGFVELEKATIEAEAKVAVAVNETIRTETDARVRLALAGVKEHWFYTAGRPAALWVFNIVSLFFGLMLVSVTARITLTSLDPLKTLNDAWPLFASFFGPLCLVNGVYLNARSKEKVAAIENKAPMPNSKVVTVKK